MTGVQTCALPISLFYCLAGAYLLSYMPMLLAAHSKGGIRGLWKVLYYPCARYLLFLPLQIMLQLSFAVLFVLGLSGMFRWFTLRPAESASHP